MVSSIFKINRSHDGAMSHRIKYLEDFFVLQYEVVHIAFVELSTTHLLKKNQDIITFPSRDICKTKKVFQIFNTVGHSTIM
jgi:hypothetical protein